MATQNLVIKSGPPEFDLSGALFRSQPAYFLVSKLFEPSAEIRLSVHISGFFCESEGETYILWGDVYEYSAGAGITVLKDKYFLARYFFSRQRTGSMSIFDVPWRMSWEQNWPCEVDTSLEYADVLKVCCLNHDFSAISTANFIQQEAGLRMSVNFRLLPPMQVVKKSDNGSGMIWYSKKYRPATKSEHLFFNLRYPETRQFFKVLCFSAVKLPNSPRSYLYTCTENGKGRLNLIEAGAELADKDNWMILVVPVPEVAT